VTGRARAGRGARQRQVLRWAARRARVQDMNIIEFLLPRSHCRRSPAPSISETLPTWSKPVSSEGSRAGRAGGAGCSAPGTEGSGATKKA
jgi:hypothetical protein